MWGILNCNSDDHFGPKENFNIQHCQRYLRSLRALHLHAIAGSVSGRREQFDNSLRVQTQNSLALAFAQGQTTSHKQVSRSCKYRTFYRKIKQGVLQFVLIKPLTAFMAIMLDSWDLYTEGVVDLRTGYLYLSVINNCSVSLSLYCLVLFYLATEERLKPFNPFYKFLTVKAVLFFSFW